MYGKREIPAPFAPQKQKAKPQKNQAEKLVTDDAFEPVVWYVAAVLLLLDLLSR